MSPRKRGNGEGSIRLRRDGRWEITVTDPATSKRRSAYAKTEAEAKRLLRQMTAKADVGVPVLDAGALIVHYATAWLEDRAGRRRAESTVREYAYRFERWILPAIGQRRLRDLTVIDVEDLFDELAAQQLARSTIKSIRNALCAMLSDAVRARHLSTNVARLAQLPEDAVDPQKQPIPTDADILALLKAARETELEPVLRLCAGTGARIGEVLAAKWEDLDLESGIWRVSRTLTVNRAGQTIIGKRTKTRRDREVFLPPELVTEIRRQRARVASLRIAALYWQDHDLVFPTTIGTPQDIHNARRDLKALTTKVGFPGSFHAIRHWFASKAVTLAPDVVVAKILGHARTATTNDLYAHLRESDAARIAVAVNVAVNPQSNNPFREEKARPEGIEPSTDRVETGCSIR
jgi:integrase